MGRTISSSELFSEDIRPKIFSSAELFGNLEQPSIRAPEPADINYTDQEPISAYAKLKSKYGSFKQRYPKAMTALPVVAPQVAAAMSGSELVTGQIEGTVERIKSAYKTGFKGAPMEDLVMKDIIPYGTFIPGMANILKSKAISSSIDTVAAKLAKAGYAEEAQALKSIPPEVINSAASKATPTQTVKTFIKAKQYTPLNKMEAPGQIETPQPPVQQPVPRIPEPAMPVIKQPVVYPEPPAPKGYTVTPLDLMKEPTRESLNNKLDTIFGKFTDDEFAEYWDGKPFPNKDIAKQFWLSKEFRADLEHAVTNKDEAEISLILNKVQQSLNVPEQPTKQPKQLIETPKMPIQERIGQEVSFAKSKGLNDQQAMEFAKQKLAGEQQPVKAPAANIQQDEFGVPGGVQSFGKGAKGEQDMFAAVPKQPVAKIPKMISTQKLFTKEEIEDLENNRGAWEESQEKTIRGKERGDMLHFMLDTTGAVNPGKWAGTGEFTTIPKQVRGRVFNRKSTTTVDEVATAWNEAHPQDPPIRDSDVLERLRDDYNRPYAGGMKHPSGLVQKLEQKGIQITDQILPKIRIMQPTTVKDVYGNTVTLPNKEEYTPLPLSNNQYILQDGKQVLVDKNQYEQARNQNIELKGVKEPEFDLGFPPEVPPGTEHDVNVMNLPVNQKANLLDYFRTPSFVLEKIGLKSEAELLKKSYAGYQKDIKTEIQRIKDWKAKVPNKESAQNIFRYLDGWGNKLTDTEQKVAGEIQAYLAEWADKLKIESGKRISHYITHIFEKDFIQKEFDAELAKIISDRIPGSVYDPFLLERLGKKGYIEDVWRALQAYTKRAVRKWNLDPALEVLKKASLSHPLENERYLMRLTSRINLRPTEIDNLIDNLIKSIPVVGYKLGQRPTSVIANTVRRAIYRGALGGNIGSAIRNVTQGINTYAALGEKYLVRGYYDLMTKGTKEVIDVGAMDDTMVRDENLAVYKKMMEKVDAGLFYLFQLAEKINRGSAYYGAKAKALKEGKSEKEAIQAGIDTVGKTQFRFGSVESPVALSSDIAKSLLTLQTFNIKQIEFLANLAKDKQYAGLLRWIIATIAVYGTFGTALGWRWKDIIPSVGLGVPGTDVIGKIIKLIAAPEDKKGQAAREVSRTGAILVPGGVQARKTIMAIGDVGRGYTQTSGGKVKFPVQKTLSNLIRGGLFGSRAFPEAKQYYGEERKPLGEKQSFRFKQHLSQESYDRLMDIRKRHREILERRKSRKRD